MTGQVVIKMTDDLFIHRTVVAESGTRLPQHAHVYDHISLISAGAVRVWAGSERLGDFEAPEGIVIKAGILHQFLTLKPDTIIDCIHRVDKMDAPEIAIEAKPLV